MSTGLTIIALCLLNQKDGLNDDNYVDAQSLVWEKLRKCEYDEFLIDLLRRMLEF